jgi:hypothetical protein
MIGFAKTPGSRSSMAPIRSITRDEGEIGEIISTATELLVASGEVRPRIGYGHAGREAIEIVEKREQRNQVIGKHAVLMG